MPAYELILSDEEIVAVLSWIKSRWPDEQREWQEEVNRGQLGEDALPEDENESPLKAVVQVTRARDSSG